MNKSRNYFWLISVVMTLSQAHAAGLGVNGTGITFPDGTIQTTAAASSSCTEVTQADIPLTVTTPGTYCLVENVNSSSTAITISANDVALNLNGHTIDGTGGSNTSSPGIFCMNRTNAVITNGTVTGFLYGISLNNCDYAEITYLRSVGNYSTGVDLLGGNSGVLIAHNHIVDIGGTTRTGWKSANGIQDRSGSATEGLRIIDNDIHDIHSRDTGAARGIHAGGHGSMVINNRISGLKPEAGGFQSGVFYGTGQGGQIQGNSISGSGSSAITINGTATALCTDNKTLGFSQAIFQCNDGGGNVAFP